MAVAILFLLPQTTNETGKLYRLSSVLLILNEIFKLPNVLNSTFLWKFEWKCSQLKCSYNVKY